MSAQEIKENLHCAFVLEAHAVVGVEDLYPTILCPFHDEDTPSFNVFEGEDGLERWNCFGCQRHGDVFSLIKEFNPDLESFEAQREFAETLLEKQEEDGWSAPTVSKKKVAISPAEIEDRVRAATTDPDLALIQSFIDARGWKFTAQWLVDNFNVGTVHDRLIIPIYTRSGELFSYKQWTGPWNKREIAAGTRFGADSYYFPVRSELGTEKPILVCEGESDTWAGHYQCSGDYEIIGLLTGAGSKPTALDRFADRPVYLAFDGDEAGTKGLKVWIEELGQVTNEIFIVPVGHGQDLSSIPSIRSVLRDAKTPTERPKSIKVQGTQYCHISNEGVASPFTNWIFEVTKELSGGDTTIYEGKLQPGNNTVTVSTDDLRSKGAIIRWSGKHKRSYWGSDRDAQLLAAQIQADAAFLPSGRISTIAGLEDNTFVWPGGIVGNAGIVYRPPTIDSHLESRIKIHRGDLDLDIIRNLYLIQLPEVTGPLLSWLAAAPLRSLFPFFPILNINGLAGSGKTQTSELAIRLFSGSEIQGTFTVSTPHAISGFISATNFLPVHLDEYRRGARVDTLDASRQLFRDAYTMQASTKGGMRGDSVMELGDVIPSAPIVVTGEDSFEEASHADRMIFVRLRKEGHKYGPFRALLGADSWFAYNYLSWLVDQDLYGYVNGLDRDAGPADLSVRQRQNIGLLEVGWKLLTDFMKAHGDTGLGELKTSLVEDELRTINNAHPLDAALADAIRVAHTTVTGVTLQKDSYIIVPSLLLNWIARNTQHKLPSGILGLERDILDRYSGERIAESPGNNLPGIRIQSINFRTKVV